MDRVGERVRNGARVRVTSWEALDSELGPDSAASPRLRVFFTLLVENALGQDLVGL